MGSHARPHYEGLYKTWPKAIFYGSHPESEDPAREGAPDSPKPDLAKLIYSRSPASLSGPRCFTKSIPTSSLTKNAISVRTGIPRSILNTVYNRGMKAWQTSGSRVGANPHQWATARVYKFVLVTKNKVPTTKFDPNKDLREGLKI